VSEQAVSTPPVAPVDTRDDPARVAGETPDDKDADAESPRSRSGDADPSLEGIPREVIENVGAYDSDIAGGCG
jgi:hypothetical protein